MLVARRTKGWHVRKVKNLTKGGLMRSHMGKEKV